MAKSAEAVKCTQQDCDWIAKSQTHGKQELGRHLKFVHGIAGRSYSAKSSRKKLSISKEMNNIIEHGSIEEAQEVLQKRAKWREKKQKSRGIAKGAYSNGEAIALITVGKIIAYCEAEAEKSHISKDAFTARCAELFFASQVR
jgi:hypothetical protein